jgi:hypothetical protein
MKKTISCIVIIFTITLIFGCQSLKKLPDGQYSVMDSESNAIRANLEISRQPIYEQLTYSSQEKCTFKEWRTQYRQADNEKELSLSVTKFENSALVRIERPNFDTSTALISHTGKLLDFNLVNPIDGKRITPEDYTDFIQQEKLNIGVTTTLKRTHFLNPFSLFMPEFIADNQVKTNQVVAVLKTDDGSLWGDFIYRGKSTFRNKDVLVLDLRRTINKGPDNEPLLFGFSLLDEKTRIPLLSLIGGEFKVVVENLACE